MDKFESIKLINDLVLRTEKSELKWEKSEYAGEFLLSNSNGEIKIAKNNNKNISFSITGSKGDIISDNTYIYDNNEDLQLYKISNVLWLLVKDKTRENSVDLEEIMQLLDEDGDDRVDLVTTADGLEGEQQE